MELRQLEYFVAVAEEENFTRAAERVHISQSGVSAQIRQLEHDLGTSLFDRSGRSTRLTPAGRAALRHARSALAAVDAVRQAVDEVNGLIRGRLVVGMVTACTVTPLFDALSAFHHHHPGVEITLLEDTSDRLMERLRAGTADLALISTAGTPPPTLETYEIIREPLVAAMPATHPLCAHPEVTLADLAQHSVVSLPTGTGVRKVFDEACAAAGVHMEIAFQAGAPSAIADLAIRGLGVAILSDSLVSQHRPHLTTRPITDIPTEPVLSLSWSTTDNPALRQLLHHCHTTFSRTAPTPPVPEPQPAL
ncbi:LysR family transcriptional regulator [Streptomyces venezuelae]|uniref:LysR family transcriptional regulator n=1 Tax=Streptomyces venezuelae TaxID=54571 RepID=A0A5P2CLK7_STRVZ|nr:LysR substrate-binding domain-containing protein [Streptomyces venezuelae]QES42987.1 LysR family transcriptional regulator [Streptomyces venezuelae]